MTPDLLAHALDYAATGWHVFPCHTPIERDGTTICSCSKGAACPEKTQGKHPRTIKGLTDATRDPEQIRKWWTMWPTANIGGIPASANLIAFDLDTDAALATAMTARVHDPDEHPWVQAAALAVFDSVIAACAQQWGLPSPTGCP